MSAPPPHERLERGFERFGRRVVRHRWPCLAAMLTLATLLGWRLPELRMDSAVETFLHADDPVRIRFDAFRDQFGRAEQLIVAVKPPDVFDPDSLRRLRDLHEALEQGVPHLDEITSLINVRSTRGEGDELIVEDLMQEFPETAAEVAALRERVRATPFYLNTVISEDGAFTSIVLTLQLYSDDAGVDWSRGFEEGAGAETAAPRYLGSDQVAESVEAVRAVMARHQRDDFQLALAGSPVITESITSTMQRDIGVFVALMLLTVAVLLGLLFRRPSGVALPLLVVALSLVSTLGAMALLDRPLGAPTQVLPTFLLAVGTGAAVHVLKIFYLRFDAGDSVEDAVAHTLGHSGLAIVMTSLTTAGGLASFRATAIAPISDLGAFAPLGILLALANCLVLLPALLAVLPLRRRAKAVPDSRPGLLGRWIVRAGVLSARNPRAVVAATLALLAISLSGVVQLRFSNDIMAWLPRSDPLLAATDLIDRELRGSMALEVIVDTQRENGVQEPALLAGLDVLRERVGSMRRGDYLFVGKTLSVSDVLKEIHQALNENRPEFYSVPRDPRLVAQELLLFENTGTDDLEDVVDSRFSLARFTLRVPYTDPMRYDGFIEDAEAEFRAVLGDGVRVYTTGFMAMMGQTMHHVIYGMARSYVLAIAIITPLMVLLLGDLRAGLVSMLPNLAPILLTLGVMGWLGIAIDMFTMMIGGIAIGLAVDDTIHFAHGFRRYFQRTGDGVASVRETLETTGQALLLTSVVLSTGFLVFTFSQMSNLFLFGVLTSFTIAAAFLIDVLISPGLLVLVTQRSAD